MQNNNVRTFPMVAHSTNIRTPGELTDREREVLSLAHLSNADIAMALGCRPSTVKAHVRHLLGKTGASNRTEACLMLMRGELGRAA